MLMSLRCLRLAVSTLRLNPSTGRTHSAMKKSTHNQTTSSPNHQCRDNCTSEADRGVHLFQLTCGSRPQGVVVLGKALNGLLVCTASFLDRFECVTGSLNISHECLNMVLGISRYGRSCYSACSPEEHAPFAMVPRTTCNAQPTAGNVPGNG